MISRKDALRRVIVLPALATLALGSTTLALAKGSKKQFKYQDHPNGNEHCSVCSLFISGNDPSAEGTCQVVEGPISPAGWCSAFTAKA